jgi:glutathione S-transferase
MCLVADVISLSPQLSYADLTLFATLRIMFSRVEASQEVVAKYPAIKAFYDGIAARDRVQAYLARDVYAKKD